ncbi:transcriptional regulator NrdR family protein [Clostridium beijerinckii]|nr:transcriptional regulator NrdR family protein [Clostridium beijerinckii]
MARLKELDEISYVRFASVYRQFKDIDTFLEEIKNLRNNHIIKDVEKFSMSFL